MSTQAYQATVRWPLCCVPHNLVRTQPEKGAPEHLLEWKKIGLLRNDLLSLQLGTRLGTRGFPVQQIIQKNLANRVARIQSRAGSGRQD